MSKPHAPSRSRLIFKSERLQFRPLGEDDVDLIAALWSDPDVIQYMGASYSESELIDSHSTIMRRCGDGCIGIWTLTDLTSCEKLGTAILLPMPIEEEDTNWDLVVGDGIPDGMIEIGYMLKKSAWGKGFATEACKRLLKFAFEDSPLEEIYATIDEENIASRNVLLKSGLEYQGIMRAYAWDSPVFRIDRKQWLAQQGD